MVTAELNYRHWCCWVVILLAAVLLYYPALDTSFLLDDLQNLRDLGLVGRDGILAYVLGGHAGPGGRPLALLSFALQYHAWPADPFAFKAVNLAVHLANACLVFLISAALGPFLKLRDRGDGARVALLAAGLWLLHPVQLSGVLYVVQRMNLLAGLFTLLGVYLYLRLRLRQREAGGWQALLPPALALYGCMLLAVLCKENGILLPLYVLCLEVFLLRGTGLTAPRRRGLLWIAGLPVVVMLAYLAWSLPGLLAAYDARPFTPGQRLLTEAGVLLDYLKIILLPHPSDFSLFHDDYPVTGSPVAALLLAGLVLVAWLLRQRVRLFGFALAWFLAGQFLESGIVPLELYFEHRNYIPCYGVLLLLAVYLVKLAQRVQTGWVALAIVMFYPLATAGVTAMELRLWSNPYQQAEVWALEHPASRRALNNLWNIHLMYGENDKAEQDRRHLQRLLPGDLYPAIKSLTVTYCYNRAEADADTWQALYARAREAVYVDHAAGNEIGYLVQQIAQGQCRFPGAARLHDLIEIMAGNPGFREERGKLYGYAASLAVLLRDPDSALADINRAIAASGSLDDRIFKLRILLALGRYEEAGRLLQSLQRDTVDSPANYIKLQRARSLYENHAQPGVAP